MISIVVVNWNSGELLARCTASVRLYASDAQVVVVDNASVDDSVDRIGTSAGASTLVLRNRENCGFAAGCNRGWRASGGDPILFLNPDAECTHGAVSALARCLADEPEAWAAGGHLVGHDGTTQAGFTVRRFPTVASVAAEALLLHRLWRGNPWSGSLRMAGWKPVSRCEVDQPAGACLMVRRNALERLGGFDESYVPAWYEDVDLCRRIRLSGGRIYFEPQARFKHEGGVSLARLQPGEFQEFYLRNQVRYFRKHFGAEAARTVRTLVIAGLQIRALLSFAVPVVRGTTRLQSARICRRTAHKLRLEATL